MNSANEHITTLFLDLNVTFGLNDREDAQQIEAALTRVAQRAIDDGVLEGAGSERIEDYRIEANVETTSKNRATGELTFEVDYLVSDTEDLNLVVNALKGVAERAIEEDALVGFASEWIEDYHIDVGEIEAKADVLVPTSSTLPRA